MEVVLLLPLALALLDVLLFERGGAVFGVPLAAVEEVVSVSQTLAPIGHPSLNVRERPLPVADVAVLLGAQAPPQPASRRLVIAARGRPAARSATRSLGQQEVVVKPLGPLLAGVAGYLGAAILGDGRVALLVEPSTLARGRPRRTWPARRRASRRSVPRFSSWRTPSRSGSFSAASWRRPAIKS